LFPASTLNITTVNSLIQLSSTQEMRRRSEQLVAELLNVNIGTNQRLQSFHYFETRKPFQNSLHISFKIQVLYKVFRQYAKYLEFWLLSAKKS
jgi:hypothetical protein